MNGRHPAFALAIACVVLHASACSSATVVGSGAGTGEVCAAEVQPLPPMAGSDPEMEPPAPIQRVEPRAMRSLMGRRVSSTVEMIVGEDGKARNVCITAGDQEWGNAVVEAVRQWQFKPAMLHGKPIAVRFRLETAFRGDGS